MRKPFTTVLWSLAALLGFGSGCDDATAPPASPPVAAALVDPATAQFVLQRTVFATPDGKSVPIDLVGSNLRVDSRTNKVSLDVALRHAGSAPLFAPARLWVGCFLPATVSVANPDWVSRRLGCRPWGFDYSKTLGEDGSLTPGETSQAKTWIFDVPRLVSFGFSCDVDFALQPEVPAVLLADRPGAEIPQDPYVLGRIQLDGSILTLEAGFSGCSPEHPFVLYAGRSFMETVPVSTWLLLAHDDGGEECTAAFQRTLHFDLEPILREHARVYGAPGRVGLVFHDFQGALYHFELEP